MGRYVLLIGDGVPEKADVGVDDKSDTGERLALTPFFAFVSMLPSGYRFFWMNFLPDGRKISISQTNVKLMTSSCLG